MIFFDTETCGYHGPVVLIQWARDDGPIQLHNVWTTPIWETLKLIEEFANEPDGVVGFNLAFDWFHLCQIYTTFILFPDPTAEPRDHINELALLEPEARFGPCLKPVTAHDIMLFARKGPYQSTMDRGDIKIRKIPTPIAWQLAEELEARIPFSDIYFARAKDKKTEKWKVEDVTDDDGSVDPNFKNITLRFKPSSALKALAKDALKFEEDLILKFVDVSCNVKVKEIGYAPFAMAVGCPENWKGAWPEVIHHFISHWSYNSLARQYAEDDVKYTRGLYKYFGSPPCGDDDSILACMVGAVRWRGFPIDISKVKVLKAKAENRIKDLPKSLATAPAVARRYITQHMDDVERLILDGSTKRILLEEVEKWENDDGSKHLAAIAAGEVLEARKMTKEIELYVKLLLAGRFHASFKVIGTLSSRMSGSDGLNPQGIKAVEEIRDAFSLADRDMGYILSGGDFIAFEVSLMEACYNDEQLRKDLQTEIECPKCHGKGCKSCDETGVTKLKIHALFAMSVFNKTYEEIIATQYTDNDLYHKGKTGVFAMGYGGTEHTLADRLGVSPEIALEGYIGFGKRYPGIAKDRKDTSDKFCSMRQPGGIGTKVEWHEPADYIESMLGFRRYFTLENRICKTLFELANDPPERWKRIKLKVVRRDRIQTAGGATMSALYAAAFNIQASNMRAAANHKIQSTGAQITKHVQRRIWDIQPIGVSSWVVQPMNIHDEIMNAHIPSVTEQVESVVRQTVEEYRELVPLIGIDWRNNISSWAGK